MVPSVGQNVGGYVIDRPVARGRSGTVYRAIAANGAAVALKLHERAEAAAQEADCLRQLNHPGIIELIDYQAPGSGDAGAWLALQWVAGQTLSHLLSAQGRFDLARTRRIVDEIAAAIDALHHAGFVHGDLSPSNILIGANDQVTIIDLAAARQLTDEPPSIDSTTGLELETTPRYASPEVALGAAPGPASDIYALALIAYEALTGTSPFADVATPISMLSHHASSTPDAPSEHRPDLPGAVEDALLDALAKDPAHRPTSAADFATRLRSDGPARSRPKPRPWVRRGLAVVAAVLLGIVIIAFVQQRQGDTPQAVSTTSSAGGAPTFLDQAGEAAHTTCNLLAIPGFEGASLPDHYYGGDVTNTAALIAGAGVDSTAALRVGANGAFGLFGEIVPLSEHRSYVFSAWMRRQGDPEVSTLYVDYLDANYEVVATARPEALGGERFGTNQGTRATVFSEAPAGAAFAVPTFFKDGSGGSLLVDEAVFGSRDGCPEGLSG